MAASGLEPPHLPLASIFWLDMLEGHLEVILGVILEHSQDTGGAIFGTDDYWFKKKKRGFARHRAVD